MTSAVFAALLDLGIDSIVAEEAARRYPSHPDSAAEWAFSSGQEWLADRPLREAIASGTPTATHGSSLTRFHLQNASSSSSSSIRPPVSRASSTVGSDAAVCDDEELKQMSMEMDDSASSAALGGDGSGVKQHQQQQQQQHAVQRAGPKGISIGDKNPFADSFQRVQDTRQDPSGELGMVLASPVASESSSTAVRAREESSGSLSTATAVTAKRARIDDDPPRGLPPSPSQSQMSLHPPPSGPPPALPARPIDQEAQDIERAIALSLQEQQPPAYEPTSAAVSSAAGASPMDLTANDLEEDEDDSETTPKRVEGSPLILRNPVVGDLFAAQVLQILLAVPQFREALRKVTLEHLPDSPHLFRVRFLRDLVIAGVESDFQYKTVATKVASTFEINRNQDHNSRVTDLCTAVMSSWQQVANDLQVAHPTGLFLSEVKPCEGANDVENMHPQQGFWVALDQELRHKHLVDCISSYFWSGVCHLAFTSISDVLCIALRKKERSFEGDGIEAIKFDEELYADRWLASNRAMVTQIGASEMALKADIKTINDEMEKYKKFRGVDVNELVEIALAHFEEPEVAAKLEAVKSRLAARVTELSDRLTQAEERLASLWNDPQLMQHKYVLRGVSFFTGWASAGSYVTYIRGDDTWWRISQNDAIKVDFATVLADDTGIYYDHGPFLFVYSREGVRTADIMPYLNEPVVTYSATTTATEEVPEPASSNETAVEVGTADEQGSPMDTASGDLLP